MGLTKRQKKFLKKNIYRFSLPELTTKLGASENEIRGYLRKIWRDEKYQKFITKAKVIRQMPFKIISKSNLKNWLKNNGKFLIILILLVGISYLNSLKNDFVSDDVGSVKENPDINSRSYFWTPPFLSIRASIFFITHKIFGLKPIFYRLVNLFFHLGSVWLIFIINSLFFKSPLPLFVASIFAVHPVLTESVTWISGGPYAQYSFFLLLSFFFYILSDKQTRFYFISIVCSVFSVLSAERAVVVTLILVSWEFVNGSLFKNWKKIIPFFLISVIFSTLLIARIGTRFYVLQTQFARTSQMENPFIQLPIVITYYLQMILFPKDLTFFYAKTNFTYLEYTLRIIGLLFYLGLMVYYYLRRHPNFFWLSFFFIALLPVLTPFRVSSIIAERYVYLGSIGIIFVIAFAFKRLSEIKRLKLVSYTLFSLLIVVLSTRTIIRNIDWKDEAHLWPATLRVSPNSVNSHHNLGNVYLNKGQIEEAIREYKIAIQLAPNYADPYNNLGYIYQQTGRFKEALEHYQKAVSFNPNLWQSYRGLAVIYFQEGNYALARENITHAIKINPKSSQLYTDLGIIYLKLAETEKAKAEFKKAQELDPNNPTAKQLLNLLSLNIKNIDVKSLY